MNIKKILVFMLIIWLCAFISHAGIEWTSTIEVTTAKGKKPNNRIDSRTCAQGGNVKQMFEGVVNEDHLYFQEGYWLFRAGENNIYIVNDNEYSYTVLPLDSLAQLTGLVGKLFKMTILEHDIKTEVLPPEELLGYDCNRIKITTKYTMKIKIVFIKQTLKVHEVREIWGTTDIDDLDQITPAFLEKDFRTGIDDLDDLIRKQMKQQKKIGFPLKMITYTIHKSKKGKVRAESTTTMTVTKIDSKTFPEKFFEVPANYDLAEGPWDKKLGVF